ncbi:hypothetical protein V8C34DRAFT_128548 [Trichoderma compactum]
MQATRSIKMDTRRASASNVFFSYSSGISIPRMISVTLIHPHIISPGYWPLTRSGITSPCVNTLFFPLVALPSLTASLPANLLHADARGYLGPAFQRPQPSHAQLLLKRQSQPRQQSQTVMKT